ncbi:MAG: cryptochrome/photolyase family protein, partial [Saprospiraceae bacterium]|nr:cryptochrome/photolyase family protein [Saprospiraceae bacterium]
ETDYVKHHIQKVIGFFLAMRHFADHLRKSGHQVISIALDDPENRGDLGLNIQHQLNLGAFDSFEYQWPDEYRLDQMLISITADLPQVVSSVDSEHFLTQRSDVANLFAGKKQFLMETFYRKVRRDYQIMMEADGKTPLTGKWNYDHENRKKLPAKEDIPEALHFTRDVTGLVQMLEKQGVQTIGRVTPQQYTWPVTREESLQLLEHFVRIRLHKFGKYQDAMTEKHYLVYHSKLSFALNTKMIHPLEVVESVIAYWNQYPDTVDIAQVEGFVRQIIGWREYMRGIYWAKMPEFASMNFLDHHASLPQWYWTGKTRMKCLSHSITQSLDYAYAHHIQRLMITGNFALLLGVDPDQLDEWYLGIYMDAIEWVEITNTRGMSQFADGGIVGTKPYVSSANYIHKMGHYCKNCHYNRKEKYGVNACPFNALYWDFYDRHRDKLGKNPRVSMMYRVLDKMNGEERANILMHAQKIKAHADNL